MKIIAKIIITLTCLFLITCKQQFDVINITSYQKDIIDSCNNYIEGVPLNLRYWQQEQSSYGWMYFTTVPIYHKKKQDVVTGYYTIVAKPYYYFSGIDSTHNGTPIYFTIIKKDGVN